MYLPRLHLFLVAVVKIALPTDAFLNDAVHHHARASTCATTNGNEIISPSSTRSLQPYNSKSLSPLRMAKKYGPMDAEIIQPSDGSGNNGGYTNKINLKSDFTNLLNAVITATEKNSPEELPSLMTKNIELILSVMGTDGLLQEIIQDDIRNSNENEERLDQISSAISIIINFTETFVEQAKSMDDVYKQLLGKIFKSIAPGGENNDDGARNNNNLENDLDELLANEKEAFTPGFLRHVDGECSRIAALPTLSPESAKMLQILRLIQTRVLEELGKGIGEGAIVLGQLLGYDDKAERLAVLDAGLAVRGIDFAYELASLTEEALEGFQSVSSGVDPALVKTVQEIDDRIRSFIDKSDFQ